MACHEDLLTPLKQGAQRQRLARNDAAGPPAALAVMSEST